jgi:hypothetical protein
MQYVNITPEDYVERDYCANIFEHIKDHYGDDVHLCVRNWDQENTFNDAKRIVIITSAEGHKYIPSDQEDPNCLGVFMHYLPKTDITHQYDTNHFVHRNKLHPLPLGSTKFFKCGAYKPMKDRQYDFTFIGQLDPYRRVEFYNAIVKLTEKRKHKFAVRFYSGWNNGVGGEKYSEILADSKIALVPWGSASLDTFRFYEAAESGCVILGDKQNDYDFMKNSPHVEIDWARLEHEIDNTLTRNNIEEISKNTRLFWEDNLSPTACARYMKNKVSS